MVWILCLAPPVNIVPLLLALITGCFFCWTFVTGMLAFATARARFAHWSPTSCCSALLSAVRMNAVQAVRYFRRSFKNLCCSATASLWQVSFFSFSRDTCIKRQNRVQRGLYEIEVLWERGIEGRVKSRNLRRKPKALTDDSHSMVSTVSTINSALTKLAKNSRWRVVLQRVLILVPLFLLQLYRSLVYSWYWYLPTYEIQICTQIVVLANYLLLQLCDYPSHANRMQWSSDCSGRLVKFTQAQCKFWCLSKLHYLDVWRSATFPEKLQRTAPLPGLPRH